MKVMRQRKEIAHGNNPIYWGKRGWEEDDKHLERKEGGKTPKSTRDSRKSHENPDICRGSKTQIIIGTNETRSISDSVQDP